MIRPILPLLLLNLLPLSLLTACAGADLVRHDPHLAHQTVVERRTAVTVIDVPDHGRISADDIARLAALARRAALRSAGPVVVQGGPADFAGQVADLLRQDGAQVIQSQGDSGQVTVKAPVWEVQAPECGQFDWGVNPDPWNGPNSNWGCALERNRALMVQNPADLVRARTPSGRDGNRAADVLGKYGRGESTSAQAEPMGGGSIGTLGQAGRK